MKYSFLLIRFQEFRCKSGIANFAWRGHFKSRLVPLYIQKRYFKKRKYFVSVKFFYIGRYRFYDFYFTVQFVRKLMIVTKVYICNGKIYSLMND